MLLLTLISLGPMCPKLPGNFLIRGHADPICQLSTHLQHGNPSNQKDFHEFDGNFSNYKKGFFFNLAAR